MRRVEACANKSGIVAAALALTAEHGWESTSLQAVRQRAGVSNGTLFHYFPSREDLAAAVVGAAMGEHDRDLLAQLHGAGSCEDAVTGVVQRHLKWVASNRQVARLLLSTPPAALRGTVTAETVDANRGFFADVSAWLHSRGWTGAPPLMAVAGLWLGPAQYYARGWLAAPDDSLPTTAADLAAGAWRALAPLLTPEDT